MRCRSGGGTYNTLYEYKTGDCFDVLATLGDTTVDLVLCDLPYGKVRAQWDTPIALDRMWSEFTRVCKPAAAVLLFATQPFATRLAASNLKNFRYDLVWVKNKSTGHLNAKRAPMRQHELVLVFYKKAPTYVPQKTDGHAPVNNFYTRSSGDTFGTAERHTGGGGSTQRYPVSVLTYDVVNNNDPNRIHSAQKPVPLLRYLVRTYSKRDDLVLDICAGSGSTAIASVLEHRRCLCIDNDADTATKARRMLERLTAQRAVG